MMRIGCGAMSAALTALWSSFSKGAPPRETEAQPEEDPKALAGLTARHKALAMRHPGPPGLSC